MVKLTCGLSYRLSPSRSAPACSLADLWRRSRSAPAGIKSVDPGSRKKELVAPSPFRPKIGYNPPLTNRFRGTFRDHTFHFRRHVFCNDHFRRAWRATQKLQTCTFEILSRRALLEPLSPQAFARCVLARGPQSYPFIRLFGAVSPSPQSFLAM